MISKKEFNWLVILALVIIGFALNLSGVGYFIWIGICFIIGWNLDRIYTRFFSNLQ